MPPALSLAAVQIGGLAVIHVTSHRPASAMVWLRCGRPGKVAIAGAQSRRGASPRERADRISRTGVLVIMRSRANPSCPAGRSNAACRPLRYSLKNPLRAKTCQPGSGQLARGGNPDHPVIAQALLTAGPPEICPSIFVDANDQPGPARLRQTSAAWRRNSRPCRRADPGDPAMRLVNTATSGVSAAGQFGLIARQLQHHDRSIAAGVYIQHATRPILPANCASRPPRTGCDGSGPTWSICRSTRSPRSPRRRVVVVPLRPRKGSKEQADIVVHRHARPPKRLRQPGSVEGKDAEYRVRRSAWRSSSNAPWRRRSRH